MSHFAVMVIGPNPEAQLAPFHEFECTGEDDQYVQEIDITAEAKKEWLTSTVTRMRHVDGRIVDAYDDQFYRDPTEEEIKEYGPFFGSGGGRGISYTSKDWGDGKGYRAKLHYVPDGWEEIRVSTADVETFVEYVEGWYGIKPVREGEAIDREDEHKFGYTLMRALNRVDFIDIPDTAARNRSSVDDVIKVVDRTNPNARWDWYQLGGRFTGYLTLKNGDKTRGARIGEPGLMTEVAKIGTADQCLKRDVDVDSMRAEARASAEKRYDNFAATVAGLTYKTWQQCAAECGEDGENTFTKTREMYWGQPYIEALHKAKEFSWMERDEIDVLSGPRDVYINQRVANALRPFAVVKDSQWFARGDMGWWGAVSNEKEQQDWTEEFNKLFDSLPDDTLISIYDCHI